MSEPVASVAEPAASTAPEPPDEPPQVYFGFHGVPVVPCRRVSVIQAQQNSGQVVRPIGIAPARSSRSRVGLVFCGTLSL